MIPDAKLAWMTGVLDLKGTIIIKNNRTRKTPQRVLMVESKAASVVGELARLTGGTAEPRKTRERQDWMQRGCVEHCPEPHIGYEDHGPGPWRMPPISRWTITGAGLAVVLHNVIPFMTTDRSMLAAKEGALADLITQGQGVGAVRAAVERLDALGWELPPGMRERISVPAMVKTG